MLQKLSKTLIFSTFVYLSFSIFVGPVDAAPKMTPEERLQAREERVAQREEARAEREAARAEAMELRQLERCEASIARIAARIEKMEDNREVHITNYERIIEKFAAIIVSLTEKGLDTSVLEADLATFEGMIEAYRDLYTDFVASLENYEGNACADMEDWKNIALQAAKDHQKALIEKRQEIRQFFAHNLREDIKMLREQAHEMFGQDEDEDVDETTESSEEATDE